jgi:PKHD-type hydroxylase
MNILIVRILEQDELRDVVEGLANGQFVDGKLTAEGPAREVKHNLQAERAGLSLAEIDRIVLGAVGRSQEFQSFAYAKCVMVPLYNRYEAGMEYGCHVDSAVMGKGADQIRTDLSMTIFLSDPASYDGGELALESPVGEETIKLEAGEAVIYPSTMLHRVTPVTRGVRLAAVTWIQSRVRDERLRAMLIDLNRAVKRADAGADQELRMLLHKAYNNLLRYGLDM